MIDESSNETNRARLLPQGRAMEAVDIESANTERADVVPAELVRHGAGDANAMAAENNELHGAPASGESVSQPDSDNAVVHSKFSIWAAEFGKKRWPKRALLLGAIVAVGLMALNNLLPSQASSQSRRELFDRSIDTIDSSLVGQLDAAFREEAVRNELDIAEKAPWNLVCRRLSLALTGKVLSLEEYRWLESIPEDQRVARWVEALLDDSRCHEYLAERFSRAFVSTHEGPFVLFRRRKFRLWLAEQIRENRPYDQIARAMIAGEGLWTDNPEVNFITATMDENENGRADPIRLAGRTSRAFLGMRIDCLQCHDDFLGNVELGDPADPREGTQHDFHRLAAFYSGSRLSENIFAGIRDDQQTYEYAFLGETEPETVVPAPPYSPELMPDEGSPRGRLAQWVTHPDNRAFSRVTVNRVWAMMFGRPLMEPIDDLPIAGPFAPGLEILAEDFTASKFDLHRLIRTIANSEVFQRASVADFHVTYRHESAWAVFPLTQLRPEQVAASVHQAARLKRIDRDSSFITQVEQFGTINDFLKDYGDRGEDEFDSESVTVSQRLLVMNGNVVSERTKPNPIVNATSRLSALASDDNHAIEVAFLTALNRPPTQDESDWMRVFIEGKRGESRARGMGDLFWSLFNTTEFLWNH